MEAHVQLLVLICDSGALLSDETQIGVLLSLPEALCLGCCLLEGYTRIGDCRVHVLCVFLELVVHGLPEAHLDVL